ncbi:MAG: NAD(P)/FAD-dependent oxidoreductase [Planctomycetota bacterium]|nr:MAG: NAD(P)/FAD-dependent oxidoreductase [Planctomycetota bacterium]
MVDKPDVIVIGGGPNGLATAAYLAKAGAKVYVVDYNQELGGGLATELATFPGFLTNTHLIYHMMVDYAPVHKDFDLENKYAVRYVWPELQFAMLFADGYDLCLYQDVDKTCQSIAAFSKHDADAYREFHNKLEDYFSNYMGPLTYMPAMPPLEQIPLLEKTELGREVSADSEKSPQELIDGYFENDQVRAMMYYLACHWGVDYDSTGLGYLAIINLNRSTNYRLCVGGSHKLASALQKVILENGGRLMGSKRIKNILVSDGAARGIELKDGTKIEAGKAVVSTIDLGTTFLKYVGKEHLDEEFTQSIEGWQWEKWSLLALHLALTEPPNFLAAAKNPDINKACVHIMGYEGTQDVIDHWKGIARGERQTTGFTTCFPSVHDSSQAPPGQCSGLISQMAPYKISEGVEKWEQFKFKWGLIEERVAVLQQYAPNISMDKVIWAYATTPLGTARRFPNMIEGSYKQGDYTNLQMGYHRPNYHCSNHRTPIDNLYLGGANSYPGGLITFGPGYLAANAVAEDQGIEKWWPEPESVAKAREEGML